MTVYPIVLLSLLLLLVDPASAQTCAEGSQTFTASGTFTVPAGCNTVVVDAWGGGGGGGAWKQAGANRGGGGGGGGAFARKTIRELAPGTPVAVTVGAGGAGGTWSENVFWTPGAPGTGSHSTPPPPPPPGSWLPSGTSIIYANGNVGIGTAHPEFKLEVRGVDGTTPELLVAIRKDGPAGENILLAKMDPLNRIAQLYADGANGMPRLSFGVGAGAPEHVTIVDTGRVGIGTTAPTERLEPGELVVIDPTTSNRVMKATRAYDAAVAGAISTQPGLILGERESGRVAVAQSGRVRIRVDAHYGAVRPGDLLVSSPTPGHAMRSEPLMVGGAEVHRPGTIIGKALESLAAGRGEILVLLPLQ